MSLCYSVVYGALLLMRIKAGAVPPATLQSVPRPTFAVIGVLETLSLSGRYALVRGLARIGGTAPPRTWPGGL